MARKLGPKCRLARREGTDLFLKSGVRSIESKCRFGKVPGQHGANKPRLSDYGVQLREKQKIKRIYGLLEKQFRNAYASAAKSTGSTGENLINILESRLDNVVYRIGFACTRAEARQLVTHKSILVNGKQVNIPSYAIKSGDIISVREKSRKQLRIQSSLNLSSQGFDADWISKNNADYSATYVRNPDSALFENMFNVNLVIELYSK
jgi:small subunit ribosomal protein S4